MLSTCIQWTAEKTHIEVMEEAEQARYIEDRIRK